MCGRGGQLTVNATLRRERHGRLVSTPRTNKLPAFWHLRSRDMAPPGYLDDFPLQWKEMVERLERNDRTPPWNLGQLGVERLDCWRWWDNTAWLAECVSGR